MPAGIHVPRLGVDSADVGSRSGHRRRRPGRDAVLDRLCIPAEDADARPVRLGRVPAVPARRDPDGVSERAFGYEMARQVARLGPADAEPVDPGLGAVTVPIAWNGQTQTATLRNVSVAPGMMTREYDYTSNTTSGSCPVARAVTPLVRASLPSNDKFEIDVSWPIPFKPFEDLADIQDFSEQLVTPLTKAAQDKLESDLNAIPGYKGAPAPIKSKVKEWGTSRRTGKWQVRDRAGQGRAQEGQGLPHQSDAATGQVRQKGNRHPAQARVRSRRREDHRALPHRRIHHRRRALRRPRHDALGRGLD